MSGSFPCCGIHFLLKFPSCSREPDPLCVWSLLKMSTVWPIKDASSAGHHDTDFPLPWGQSPDDTPDFVPTNLHGDFCTCHLTPAPCPPNPSPVPDEAMLSQATGQAPLLARIPYPVCCFKKPLSRRCTSSCLSSLISSGRLGAPLPFVTLVT